MNVSHIELDSLKEGSEEAEADGLLEFTLRRILLVFHIFQSLFPLGLLLHLGLLGLLTALTS